MAIILHGREDSEGLTSCQEAWQSLKLAFWPRFSKETLVIQVLYTVCWPRAAEMAQWLEALATKSEDLSSIPGTHGVEGEN